MRLFLGFSCALLAATTLAGAAHAQADKGVPNALQGFSTNRDKPVHIEAASLEVRDKDKVATFSGDVRVVQGDTNMRCQTLVVYYDQEKSPNNLKAADPGPKGQQQIRRLEAKGGVTVTQKDQVATGETANFEMKTNTVVLNGNVVVTQGQNVLRGDRLVVDLTSGISHVESGKPGQGGRVQGLFVPKSSPEGAPEKPKPGGKDVAKDSKDTPKARPAHPQGLY
ncbi:MAG: lipopolysaccharide transport periplasmic protein LptA [Pseudorhodoplanes sp.]